MVATHYRKKVLVHLNFVLMHRSYIKICILMTRKSIYGTGIMLIATGMLLFTACKRNASSNNNNLASLSDDDKGYGNDQAALERENNDVISMADLAANTGSVGQAKGAPSELSGCATVNND